MVERRGLRLALTADLSGAITRSVGAFRSNFERLPERLMLEASQDSMAEAPCAHARKLPPGHQGRTMLNKPASDLGRAAASLDALSPLKVLARGYSIAYSDDGGNRERRPLSPVTPFACAWRTATMAATVDTVE